MFLASLRYIDFQTGHFADFEQFKIDGHFSNLDKCKLTLLTHFHCLWAGDIYFTEFGLDIWPQKTIQTSV